MMNYIVSGNGTITIVANSQSYAVGNDHPNYDKIKDCLAVGDEHHLDELLDIPKAVVMYAEGLVEVTDGVLSYDGEEMHNALSTRIMQMMRDGFPFKPMLKFLANVLENSSNRAVEELYTFLEHKSLPITDDGCFLAYKAVNSSYKDKWTGTIDNSVGQSVSMHRRKVNDNCQVGCSDGLHCGAIEYVEGYSNPSDKIVIVKVNPRDVVSVPTDSACQKVRTCAYDVVAEYDGPLNRSVYADDGQDWEDADHVNYDDSYDNFDDEIVGENGISFFGINPSWN